MRPHPSPKAEAIVAFFTPPACREEVLGDLHERYRTPRQYAVEALSTIPLVAFSRVRRIKAPQFVLWEALAIYLSFVAAAWLTLPSLLHTQTGFLRLAVPAVVVLLLELIDAAYAKPTGRHPLVIPILSLSMLIISQLGPPATRPYLRIVLNGWFLSLILLAAIHQLLISHRPRT